jgi:hypothetical protein
VSNAEVVYREQSCHNLDVELAALMVTDNPYKEVQTWNDHVEEYVTTNVAMPTVIMICPWFVDCKKYIYKPSNCSLTITTRDQE